MKMRQRRKLPRYVKKDRAWAVNAATVLRFCKQMKAMSEKLAAMLPMWPVPPRDGQLWFSRDKGVTLRYSESEGRWIEVSDAVV